MITQLRRQAIFASALVSILLVAGCVPVKIACPATYYWPNPGDDSGVQLRRCDYTKTTIDDTGHKWLAPRDGTNFIYRADLRTHEVTRIELDGQAADIAAGAGFVWAVPIRRAFANFKTVHKIEPTLGTVDAVIELPKPYNVFDIWVGQDFVWLHGALAEGFWSRKYVTTQIDPKANLVVAMYEHPEVLALKDGSLIKSVGLQSLALIDENDYLLLRIAQSNNGQWRWRDLKLSFDTGEYSVLEDSQEFWASCPQGEDIILTETGAHSCTAASDALK